MVCRRRVGEGGGFRGVLEKPIFFQAKNVVGSPSVGLASCVSHVRWAVSGFFFGKTSMEGFFGRLRDPCGPSRAVELDMFVPVYPEADAKRIWLQLPTLSLPGADHGLFGGLESIVCSENRVYTR